MPSPVRRRSRRTLALALAAAWVLVAGCQVEGRPNGRASSAPATTTPTSGAVSTEADGLGVVLTPRLPRRAATSVSRTVTVDPAPVVGLATIREAPLLAPGERFRPEVAFVLNIFAPAQVLPYDRIWLASRAGAVRTVDLRALGVSDPDRGERDFALSPDRESLAVADTGRILVVDLATDAVRAWPIDVDQPVALTWVPGADAVWFTDRTVRTDPTVSRLDLADGAVSTLSFDLIGSSAWPEAGGLVRLGPDRATGTTDVLTSDDGGSRVVGTLPVVTQSQGYPSCSVLCAVTDERTRVDGAAVAPGVTTFDPASGRFGPTLGVLTTGLETLDLAGWSTPTTLDLGLAADGVTRLLRWDVETDRVRVLLEVEVQGLVLGTAHG